MTKPDPTWHPLHAPCGWRKGWFDMRLVTCPRTGKPDFVATRKTGLVLPKETAGRRWRVWTCRCGAKRSVVAWKNDRARRMYSLTDLEWAEKHAGCRRV